MKFVLICYRSPRKLIRMRTVICLGWLPVFEDHLVLQPVFSGADFLVLTEDVHLECVQWWSAYSSWEHLKSDAV